MIVRSFYFQRKKGENWKFFEKSAVRFRPIRSDGFRFQKLWKMCLIEFCPLNFLRLIWTLWSICGTWKLQSNTNLLKFFKNRCERFNQSGPRVSDFKTCNHSKAKNSSAPWICCNLLIINSSVTPIIFNWKWKRPVLGMPGTDGLSKRKINKNFYLFSKATFLISTGLCK